MNLAELPSDIIRNVVRLNLNSIDSMRRISPTWNSLVAEYLRKRAQLPMIECVRWDMCEEGKSILYMLIPSCYRRYFGAAKWTYTHNDFGNHSFGWFNFLPHNHYPAQVRPGIILAPIFQRCARVKKLKIDKTIDLFSDQVDGIGGVLFGDTIFEELRISNAEYFHPSDLDSILNAVRGGRVLRVVLSPSADYYRYMKFEFLAHNKFVSDVAKCLGMIEMASSDVSNQQNMDLRRTKLSAYFPMSVTIEEMPFVRIVLEPQ